MKFPTSFCVFVALCSNAAMAQTPYSPNELLRGELKVVGIDASQIDWMAMDALCAVYRGQQIEHTACVKQKVLDKVQFNADKTSCLRSASQAHPALPSYQYPIALPAFKTQQAEHQYYRHLHQRMQLATKQAIDPTLGDYSYETCMQKKGWADPTKWQAGKKAN